jgi:PIN domain nuclease of toxin-antitoxin system
MDDPRLSAAARKLIADPATELHFSAASSWELAIKVALGRLELPEPPRRLIPKILREQSIRPLDITHTHALAVSELPAHHRDPFDRLLVAQAKVDRLALVTGDAWIEAYPVRIIW